jgi:DNA helicase IV
MHPDLPYEQAYFDRALALRDRQQADLARAPRLAANPRAAVELRRRVSKLGLADPDEAVAFGRIDAAENRWYIGKGAIWDDDNELVVVNWQAPIAAPFYTATPDAPEGLDARRLFRCSGNQIREIEDVVFRDLAEAIVTGREPEPVLTDALLETLGSARSGELVPIVATIQAAQYGVISRGIDQLLVVQGGPGTGKTVVGLHRVSWLLFNRRDRLDVNDVLIVGPNPAFVHYISSVLPTLGDEAVLQLPLRALGPRVRVGRVDTPEVRRLKGDRRMLRLILRGLRNRQRVDANDVDLMVGGRRVRLDGRRLATRARQLAGRPHNAAHRMLRAFALAEARAALGRAGLHDPAAVDAAVRGESAREIDNHLDRVWPSLTPQAFLVELLSSRRQLLAAGSGLLSEAELALLAMPADAQVSSCVWSEDDVPLLDAADALLNGVTATYEHIVVDEAQDLSPLQLESIRRRSRAGSMTILGDLAQATSPWAHESWDAVVRYLRHGRVTATGVELEYGYRLPAEVHEVAMRLLPGIAPNVRAPRAVRASGHDVEVVEVGRSGDPAALVEAVVATVDAQIGAGIVGVITPPSTRSALVAALDGAGIAWAPELRPAAAPVVVLTPDDAKGLEFDAVVVVEPAAIVDESAHGLRSLFVAMTRCTNRLALVHARPLPAELGLGPEEEAGDEAAAEDTMAVLEPGWAVEPEADSTEPEPAAMAMEDEPVPEAEPAPVVVAVGPDWADEPWAEATEAEPVVEPEVVVPVAVVAESEPLVEPEVEVGRESTVEPEPAEPTVEAEPEPAEPTVEAKPESTAEPEPVVEPEVVVPVAEVAEPVVEPEPRPEPEPEAGATEPEPAVGPEVVVPVAMVAQPEPAAEPELRPEPAPVAAVARSGPGAEREPAPEPGTAPESEDPAPVAGLADRVVVSTPGPDLAATLDALGDLDRDIARAVAAAVVERLEQALAPALLPVVVEEIVAAVCARKRPSSPP